MVPEKALTYVHRVEGGYVNDPDDPGGATNMGITQAVYDDWLTGQGLPPRDVAQISRQQVNQIYEQQYWVPGKCHLLIAPFNLLHFDACVNLGKPEDGFKRSIKILQAAINEYYRGPQVSVDGVLGPLTREAVVQASSWPMLKDCYLWQRVLYYNKFRHGRLKKFIPGWIWRLTILREEATRD